MTGQREYDAALVFTAAGWQLAPSADLVRDVAVVQLRRDQARTRSACRIWAYRAAQTAAASGALTDRSTDR